MSQLPFALQLLVLIVSGWVNRRQQLAIEYLLEENRVVSQNSIVVSVHHSAKSGELSSDG